MPTRRDFLRLSVTVAALALGDLPMAGAALPKKRKLRYLVATTSPYWGKPQDLGAFAITRKFPLPPEFKAVNLTRRSAFTTVFTVVDEDGTNLRRFELPGPFHSSVSHPQEGLIYLISDGLPALVVVLDMDTLELVQQFSEVRQGSTRRNFTGHAVPIPGTNTIAFGMNYPDEIGKFGEISIRDARTLRERAAFPSYGFDLHEVRLSRDRRHFVCGHYGSYLGHWAYRDLMVYGGYDHPAITPPAVIYPGSVALVDVRNGSRYRLLSDIEGGQQGHVDSDERDRVYLACRRALLESRPGAEQNGKFLEGRKTEADRGEFALTQRGAGIALAYDPHFHEVIVPVRNNSFSLLVTDTRTQRSRTIDLLPQVGWEPPTIDFTHGIALHPDGKHYILSTSAGFVAVERGTHKVNREKTIPVPLLIHTHMHIA